MEKMLIHTKNIIKGGTKGICYISCSKEEREDPGLDVRDLIFC